MDKTQTLVMIFLFGVLMFSSAIKLNDYLDQPETYYAESSSKTLLPTKNALLLNEVSAVTKPYWSYVTDVQPVLDYLEGVN